MTNKNGQYQQSGWLLQAIFPGPEDAAVEETMKKLETTTAAIEDLRPTLLSSEMSGKTFAEALKTVEIFVTLTHRLGSYGPLWFSEDTQNQNALALMGKMEQLITEAHNRILF